MKKMDLLEGKYSYYPDQHLLINSEISFSIVYSKDLSLWALYEFFSNNRQVNQNISNFGFVTDADTDYYTHYKYDPSRVRGEHDRIFQEIIEKFKTNRELNWIERSFITEHSLMNKTLKVRRFSALGSTCYFDDRLYISTDGKFHICEKMNHTFPIGSVENGYNFPRMLEIMNEYMQTIQTHCSTCDVRFICARCFPHLAKDGVMDIDKEFCDNYRRSLLIMLEETILLNEAGAFK